MNKNITVDNLDIPPDARQDAPWVLSTRPAPRETWDTIVARYGMGVLVAALGWWAAPEWAHAYIVGASCVIGSAAAAKHVLQDKIAGFRVWTWRNDVRSSQIAEYLGTAAVEDARRQMPRGMSSYSPTIQQAPAPKALAAAPIEAESVTILPNVGPLPPAEWLARLDAQPHAIFAAKTKGGKSTMAKFGMQPRIARGESFFVIDPHSNGWLDLPSVGGGLRWNEVGDAITHVTDVYRQRQDERRRFLDAENEELDHNYFPRLNVILDEANETRLSIDKRVWEPFLQVMGSGARKCGISLWLICQSALIKNLGGSETLRRNYTIFALDHETIGELVEGTDRQRRDLIMARIAGADFPACMVDQGLAFLLDRTGIDRAPIASARGLAWQGWQPRRMTVAPHKTPDATLRATASVKVPEAPSIGTNATPLRRATPVATLSEAQRDALVRTLRAKRKPDGTAVFSQDVIRAQLERGGLSIAQERLVRLCQEVDAKRTVKTF